jgi:NhaP-type Na+/H+ or K+/H+ antiporter
LTPLSRDEDAPELVVPVVVALVMGLMAEAMEFSCRSFSTAREVAFEFLNPLGTIGLVVVTLAALLLRPAGLRL